MSSFSFVHAADLHLDSPFSAMSLDNPQLARHMRSATFESFENIIRLCIEKDVDFFLVAGDIFDGSDRSLRAQVKFRDGLKKLHDAGISSYVVHGNHDPIGDWATSLEWPPSAHIFKDNIESCEAKRSDETLAIIQGISFLNKDERRNLSQLFKRLDQGTFHVGLLHANVGSNTGHEPYAPCSIEDLRKSGMDYWALGHVHKRKLLSKESPVIIYPGNSQGRNIRETGEKGCFLVKVSDSNVIDTEFCPTDVIRWIIMEIPINDIVTEQELLNTLESVCRDISENQSGRLSIVRIIITGNSPLFGSLKRNNNSDLIELLSETGSMLDPSVFIERIILDIAPELDIGELRIRPDFTGELLRYSEDLAKDPDFSEIIRDELALLFEDPRARRFIDFPDHEKLHDILKQATNICLAGLYEGDNK